MDPISLQQLAIFSGGVLTQGNPDQMISGITHDTRKLSAGMVYLALAGERFDGRDFIPEAIRLGASGVIAQLPLSLNKPIKQSVGVIGVLNPLQALHQLADRWRSELKLTAVAITGSNGKTSTKEFLGELLKGHYRRSVTVGNYNNHIGVPLSILAASRQDRAAIWEIGMNHAGEIAPLAAMARPDIGIITSIGKAHIGHLGSQENIAHEKGTLVATLPAHGCAILPATTPFLGLLRSKTKARVITVGLNQGDIQACNLTANRNGTHFRIIGKSAALDHYSGEQIDTPAFIPLWGEHMVHNALIAWVAALQVGLPLETAITKLTQLRPSQRRFTIHECQGYTLIDDSYNASPDSMQAALKTLSEIARQKALESPQVAPPRKIALLGAMGELGEASVTAYHEVGLAAAEHTDILITVGPEAKNMAQAAQASHHLQSSKAAQQTPEIKLQKIYTLSDHTATQELLCKLLSPGDILLIKASRSAQLDLIANELLVQVAPEKINNSLL